MQTLHSDNANNLSALIAAAEANAFQGCGQSDVLYEERLQDAFADILARSPESERANTEAILRARGYDPDFTPYERNEGECALTGIDEHCCPCGRHP